MIRLTGDHPRSCGEKHYEKHKPIIDKGSPPLMRGKEKVILTL